jgi:hypothetical protein
VTEGRIAMKLREMYSNSVMVGGLLSLLLGIGNWTVGAVESAKYQALIHKTAQTGLEESYRSFQELDQQKNDEVLRHINDNREKYNGARVKLNFFYVVLTGGRLLCVFGLIATVFAAFRLIRHDAQVKIRRISGFSG